MPSMNHARSRTNGVVSANGKILFLAINDLPAGGCYDSADEGANDKYPELCKSLASFEEGRTDASGGVDASASVVDAYQVDENERQTDG